MPKWELNFTGDSFKQKSQLHSINENGRCFPENVFAGSESELAKVSQLVKVRVYKPKGHCCIGCEHSEYAIKATVIEFLIKTCLTLDGCCCLHGNERNLEHIYTCLHGSKTELQSQHKD